jgi:uncharacterized protein with GYD domain
MAKYLFSGSYTEAGLQGFLKEGGSARREATEQLMKSLGGSLEAYYFAFGGQDFYLIADLPDNRAAAAASLVAAASGAVKPMTTVLLTPEEIDEAVSKTADYRPPGG